jgi:hypothetical protein
MSALRGYPVPGAGTEDRTCRQWRPRVPSLAGEGRAGAQDEVEKEQHREQAPFGPPRMAPAKETRIVPAKESGAYQEAEISAQFCMTDRYPGGVPVRPVLSAFSQFAPKSSTFAKLCLTQVGKRSYYAILISPHRKVGR